MLGQVLENPFWFTNICLILVKLCAKAKPLQKAENLNAQFMKY